jgi:hypothetical protein
VVHQRHSGRAGLAREAGRRLARGEYIQYLDSDDLLAPSKFVVMVRGLEDHPECDIAYCYTRRYRRGLTPENTPVELTGLTFPAMLPTFLHRRFWHTSTPIYRRRLCDRIGPWSDLADLEDVEYDMRAAALGARLHHCPAFLTDMRDHDGGRLSEAGVYDAEHLRHLPRAYALIYESARRGGVTHESEAMRFFLEDLRLIGNRCRALGLDGEADRLFAIGRQATPGQGGVADPPLTLRAVIEPLTAALNTQGGRTVRLPVRVVNESTLAFRYGCFPAALSYHLLSGDGTMRQWENARVWFDEPLRPRESRLMELAVQAPDHAGAYRLEVDILWENMTWLKALGNEAPLVELIVED